jgi:tyrosyl-DNA phosphodiesterase 2
MAETKSPESLVFISWNIDRNPHYRAERTVAVCRVLKQEVADIVFLQEVAPTTLPILKASLPGYQVLVGRPDQEEFVATLLRKETVHAERCSARDFSSSMMQGPHVVVVEATCGGHRLELLNTHLVCSKAGARERVGQLQQCLDRVVSRPADTAVILAGDLNLRDQELAMVRMGGLPAGVRDVWEECGASEEKRWTWDMERNGNLRAAGLWEWRTRPKLRFDRIYMGGSVSSDQFGLLGRSLVPETPGLFP